MRIVLALVSLSIPLLAATNLSAQESALPLMPWPATVNSSPAGGQLVISASFAVSFHGPSNGRLQRTVEIFLNDLRRHTGMLPLDFSISATDENAQLQIQTENTGPAVDRLGEDESYNLEVSSSGAALRASTDLGAMRGLQTFLQLVHITPQGFAVPAIEIHDRPRFAWRGLMIDCSRHFMPVATIKRNLDGMAAVKLNVFHWHLSDDQGFRVESKRFPKLQGMGSDGLYYTQDQVRDIVQYARDRGIRVVPEFDMPGHSTSWFVGYPELASGPGPYSIQRGWGVFNAAMDPTRESTYKFLDKFIGEMSELFPDQYFHIGGDEVNGKQWDANPKIQKFMPSHNLKTNADLQAYFNQRLQEIVTKHHKIMEGWDEILRPDLPKDVVIQSWRGQDSLAAAAQQGYRGLLSSGYYLDLMQPASTHYAVDPMAKGAANLSAAEKQRILGGEACMWAEYVSPENVDSRIWPRLAAIAERLWSPQNVTDLNSMYARTEQINYWLDAYGLTQNTGYEVMLRRMAGSNDTAALRTLVDVIEPVRGYARGSHASAPSTSLTPLNRAIDAARPESELACQFADLVSQFVSGKIQPGMEEQIRSLLRKWRDNDDQLRPVLDQSSLLQGLAPQSQALSALGLAGLEALDYLDHGAPAPPGWKAENLELIQQASTPHAQVQLAVAPAIATLINSVKNAPVQQR